MALNNLKLFELFRKSTTPKFFTEAALEELDSLYGNIERSEIIKNNFYLIYANIKAKWVKTNRTIQKFNSKYEDWLNEDTILDILPVDKPTTSTRGAKGRPKKSIEECSIFTRKRKLAEATNDLTTKHLSDALSIKYTKDSERVRSQITKSVADASPLRLKRIKESIPTPTNAHIKKYGSEEALALFMDLELSKEKYEILRASLMRHGAEVLPGYKHITQAKINSRPLHTEFTEVSVKANLQDLMGHTAKRLLESLPENEVKILPEKLTLISKWGCDGSSGQSVYKQRISSDDATISDGSMFMASVVPLRLKSDVSLHWKNPRPSSVHYCRPIMFQFARESAELIRTTVKDIEEQISKIKPTKLQIGEGKYIECNYEFHLTMVDGKVVNELTGTTSTLSCPICKKSQNNFGNLNDSTNEENYEYGMSPLQARIRCMVFLLKLAHHKRRKLR